jgi:hypothetical protein
LSLIAGLALAGVGSGRVLAVEARLNRAERRWCLALSGVVMVLTSLPYLAGYAGQGEDWTFSGFVFGVGDGNSYIAKMLQGANGAWLFRTPYSAHPGSGIVAFLLSPLR